MRIIGLYACMWPGDLLQVTPMPVTMTMTITPDNNTRRTIHDYAK